MDLVSNRSQQHLHLLQQLTQKYFNTTLGSQSFSKSHCISHKNKSYLGRIFARKKLRWFHSFVGFFQYIVIPSSKSVKSPLICSQVVFRASRSNNFYLALLLTMLFLCVLPVGFAIVWIEPSWHCGPFSSYGRIYYLFTDYLHRALHPTLQKALDYVASPAIVIPLLMLLVLIIYYLVSLTSSLREANADLKIQLRRERTEERRKMFQLVDKKNRKGSGESDAFAKWKNILPDYSPQPEKAKNDNEKVTEEATAGGRKTQARKGIFFFNF